MPTYDYKCDACGAEVELNHPMAEVNDEHTCPECGAVMRRRFAPTPHRWVHPDEKKLGKHINDVI